MEGGTYFYNIIGKPTFLMAELFISLRVKFELKFIINKTDAQENRFMVFTLAYTGAHTHTHRKILNGTVFTMFLLHRQQNCYN